MAECISQGKRKKLIGAAEHWLRGSVKDDTQDDAKALGVILPETEDAKEHYEVFEENWETVTIFLRCQTQWRTGGMGGVIGLDYGVVQWMFSLYDVKEPRAVLDDLQVMEHVVLKEMTKRTR